MADGPSPTWGGGTGGLLIGLVVGFFTQNYWRTVVYAVIIGAALGFASDLLSRIPPKRS